MSRRRVLLAAAVLLPLSTCGAIIAYQRWWFEGARTAVHSAVESIRGQRPPPTNVIVHADSTIAQRITGDAAVSYALTEGDTYLAGTEYFGTFVSPGAWVAEARFTNGVVIEFEVHRRSGQWVVWFRQPHVTVEAQDSTIPAPDETAQN